MKKHSPSDKSKDPLEVSKIFQSRPYSSSSYSESWPRIVLLRQGPCMLVAFVVGRHVLHWGNTYKCYNGQAWRWKPTNAQTMKFSNYLHLQFEQLLRAF